MRIWAASDLHGFLPDPPEAGTVDVAVLAGDLAPDYPYPRDKDLMRRYTRHQLQAKWVKETLDPWLETFPCPVYGTWGNHDFQGEELVKDHPKILQDTLVVIDGVRFYFSPWSLSPPMWAFRLDDDQLAEKLRDAPDHVDILVSHGPPFGPAGRMAYDNLGYKALDDYAIRAQAQVIICGHIHERHGHYPPNPPGRPYHTFSVSVMDRFYDPVHAPRTLTVRGP
jgi:Icc-related predicted phosphoesterase